MKKILFTLLIALSLSTAGAQNVELRAALFESADAALKAAQELDAELLAPTSFKRGMDSYRAAERDLERGRNLDWIRTKLATATGHFKQSVQSAEVGGITLASSVKTRNAALTAQAPRFASDAWVMAERSFSSAAKRLENGDIKGARKRSSETEVKYRDAELIAIKAQYLSQTRALLLQADKDRVKRYAPVTLDKARGLLARAEQELNDNRYDTDLPRSLAQEANYEARHAIYLAKHIRKLRDAGVSVEEVILAYEQPLQRIAASADKVAQLDEGTETTTVELSQYIEDLREQETALTQEVNESRERVANLEDEIRELDEQLGGASAERIALVQRLEAEARIKEQFERVEKMFTRDEARVYRQGNVIILRLVGVTFPSGQSDVDFVHGALLRKVREAINTFPNSNLVVEGHTDSFGGDDSNMALSEARAQSVGRYMVSELAVPSYRIGAEGFGETKPIANNETAQGRTRNRRIDIRIEPQQLGGSR
jgi:OOP family OmpA-OmpF porin